MTQTLTLNRLPTIVLLVKTEAIEGRFIRQNEEVWKKGNKAIFVMVEEKKE